MTVIAERPQPGVTRDYHFPRFERRTLANGITVIVAPMPRLPIVTATAVIDAGAVSEPAGAEGVAQLTASALLEGAAGYSGEALADRFESVGTSVDTSADWDATIVRMNALVSVFPAAFSDFANLLIAPTFPDTGIERLKGERLAEILHTENEPRELANEQFDKFVYRGTSRYHVPLGGTKTSVPAITRQDCVDFYSARYAPASTTIILTGDITTDEAVQLVQDALGAWTGNTPPVVAADDQPAYTGSNVHIVHRANAPQSELRIGHVGVPRLHPDHFPITVMNAILGGLFGSRINLNLREAHGYTYGAFSSFDWRRQAGPFAVSTAVASNVTGAAIKEVVAEITRMRNEPVTEKELTLATAYLDGVFPIRFETTHAVANALSSLVVYGLPDDWQDKYRERIRAVTTGDVLRAAQTYLSEQLQFVVVGDAEAIQEPLEALQLGPVQVHHE